MLPKQNLHRLVIQTKNGSRTLFVGENVCTHPEISYYEQISKLWFLENWTTRQKTGFRHPGQKKLCIKHLKSLLDNILYSKLLQGCDLGKNRKPDTFCPGKFLHPEIYFYDQISKIWFLENRTTGQKTGFRHPGNFFWSKTIFGHIQITWDKNFCNTASDLAEIASQIFMYGQTSRIYYQI